MARDDNNKNDGGSGGITYDSPYYLHPSDYPKQLHENKTSHESAAFKAFQRHNGPPGLNKERSRAKSIEEGNKNCTECNEDGHTREGCFKFLALGWLLEEIYVTWAHLEKKWTRLRTYTKSMKKYCSQSVETASYHMRRRRELSIDVRQRF
ncbi:hypothetical protein Tco_0645939 [Tanacetum coccineum]